MKKYVIAIDMGGTNTEMALVDNEGVVVDNSVISTCQCELFEDFIQQVGDVVLKLIARNDLVGKVHRIGIGAPNANYHAGTIENAANLRWKGVLPFAKMLEAKTGMEVVMTNDANAAAIGEHVFGAAKGMADFIVVTLGTGLGSGFFVNGALMYGHEGFAGELGHVVVAPDSERRCGCGRFGCLETFVSASGIVKTASEKLQQSDVPSVLRSMDLAQMTVFDVAQAGNSGDAVAIETIDATAKILALALANAVVISNPQAIFISGGIAKTGALLFDPLNAYFNQFVLGLFKDKVQIQPSALLEKNTGLLGAAALVL